MIKLLRSMTHLLRDIATAYHRDNLHFGDAATCRSRLCQQATEHIAEATEKGVRL
jgi:hypothetical protein